MELAVGPFELIEPLGRGGMGEVWRGRHRDGTPVAIKRVLVGSTEAVAGFRDEVRAMARLDHPGVVAIFDHGVLDDGEPYLVMELLPHGSLDRAAPPRDWVVLRALLLDLLDALAHAHARGLVHRDLKPANVLLRAGEERDRPLRPVLADFGLAHALDVAGGQRRERRLLGTPHYMAPEQCRGALDRFGPWTDLYALGCVAWELVTGAPPIDRATTAELLEAHQHAAPSAFRPRIAVPGGLEDWLRALLEKSPEARFRRAADADWALRALGDPTPSDPAAPGVGPGESDTGSHTVVISFDGSATCTGEAPLRSEVPPAPPRRRARPPLPDSPGSSARRGPQPSGAGLALFRLRATPLVGRTAERERIWAALAAVDATGAPRAVVVRGPAGIGKSRLVEALAERAHEVGAVEVVRYGAARPTYAEVVRVAQERPALLWIDDGRDLDGLALARTLLEAPEPAPVLALITARDEDLVRDGAAAKAVEALARLPGVEALTLEPLAGWEQHELVQQLIGLRSDVADAVVARTAGHPLFAVQLVGDWVRRGVLVPSPGGFELADPGTAHLPDALHEVWSRRLAGVLEAWGTDGRAALEIAAALGMSVRDADWARVCEEAGVRVPDRLVDALLDERLALRDEAGWGFAHGLLRESVEREARDGGRWAGWCAACARGLPGGDDGDHDDRTARWLRDAGDLGRALPLLVRAGRRELRRGRSTAGRALLLWALDACDEIAIPPRHPARVEARLGIAISWHQADDPRIARAEYEQAVAEAVPGRDDAWRAEALYGVGDCLHRLGDGEGAEEALRQAVAIGEASGERRSVIQGFMRLARLAADRGRRAEAIELGHEAVRQAEGGSSTLVSRALCELANAYDQAGDLERARELYERALDLLADAPSYALQAINGLAEIARRTGDYDAAERGYQRATEIIEQIGSGALGPVLLNRALLALARGRYAEADAILARARRVLLRAGGDFLLAAAHLLSTLPSGQAGRWDELRHHVAASVPALLRFGFGDPDVARAAAEAARLASSAGLAAEAADLEALAREQQRILGPPGA